LNFVIFSVFKQTVPSLHLSISQPVVIGIGRFLGVFIRDFALHVCNSSAGKLELNSLSIGLFDHNNGSKENDLNIFPLYHSTN